MNGYRTGALSVPEGLHEALEAVLVVTGATAATLRLCDEQNNAERLEAAVGLSNEQIAFERSRSHCGICAEVMQCDQVRSSASDCELLRLANNGSIIPSDTAAPFAHTVAAPLTFRGHPIGVLTLFFDHHPSRNGQWKRLLVPLGQLIGLSFENARLEEMRSRLWLLRSKQLLAAELHDGLAQRLTFARMQLAMILQENAETAGERDPRLIALKELLEAAHHEVRELIRCFTTEKPHEDNYDWRTIVQRFAEENPNIVVRVDADEPTLPGDTFVAEQLYFIVQEALNNIRKHACAHKVFLSWRTSPAHHTLTIQDDGVGLSPPASRSEYPVGLQLMRKRAEAIGADLTIDSPAAGGTIVRVILKDLANDS
ncbi:MAG: ATP-binding protein [Hydrogenophilus sp.]